MNTSPLRSILHKSSMFEYLKYGNAFRTIYQLFTFRSKM
jgi:hypothetical protein